MKTSAKDKKKLESIFMRVIEVNSVKDMREINSKVKRFLDYIKERINKKKVKADVVVGGSLAKGTIIKGGFDCDIFVRFDSKIYKDANISNILKEMLDNKKTKMLHGSRNYFQIHEEDINYEIVPVLKVKRCSDGLNVTDSSPLHVKWILEKIKQYKSKKIDLRKEIILAKVFCKANDVYGAESYIRGFSGHVIDILIAYYGGFVKLLEGSQKWREGDIIDIKKHNKVENQSKLVSPLIVVDPIHDERNAAASLSKEKFDLFKKKARTFLENPDFEFFVKEEKRLEDLLKEKDIVVLKIILAKNKEDIMGARIVKILEHLENNLREYGVKDTGYIWDKSTVAYGYIKYQNEKISDTFEREGPPKNAKEHFDRFVKKHTDYILKKGRAYATVRRDIFDIREEIREILKHDNIVERVKSIEVVD